MPDIQLTLFNNPFVLFFIGIFLARASYPLIKFIFSRISKRLSPPLKDQLLSLSKVPYALLIFCGFWFIGLPFFSIKADWIPFIIQTLQVILCFCLIAICYQILDILEIYIKLLIKNKDSDTIHKSLLPYSKKIIKFTITFIFILFILQNAGFNVTSLLAGLGIGGVAIALGAKETLTNLFGGLTIIMDRPFAVGDWIHCGDVEGTVEDIGFRSTQIKTFYDSIVTLPNSIVASSVVDNLGRRQSRRTQITLDLTYDTAPEELESFVEGVKNILEANKYIKKDSYQVYFSGYSSSSLQIFINFFLKVSNWDAELLQKQNIFLEILRLSKELNLSFAFPTQTLDIPFIPTVKEKHLKDSLDLESLKTKPKSFGPKGDLSQPEGLGIYKPPNK